MADVECPYCGLSQEVNHDDGYGYAEDQTHQQECPECEKSFTYTTAISFTYSAAKADCLNGGEHDWQPTFSFPIEATKGCCSMCGLERRATQEDMAAAISKHDAVAELLRRRKAEDAAQ